MTIHKSLRLGSGTAAERSVWTRRERLERLREEGRRKGEEGSPFGLPKVRTKRKTLTKKQKKDAAEAAAAAPAAGEAPAE
jgi:small basic protein (TIGR04137 family)